VAPDESAAFEDIALQGWLVGAALTSVSTVAVLASSEVTGCMPTSRCDPDGYLIDCTSRLAASRYTGLRIRLMPRQPTWPAVALRTNSTVTASYFALSSFVAPVTIETET
jgi:hypothetical protein